MFGAAVGAKAGYRLALRDVASSDGAAS